MNNRHRHMLDGDASYSLMEIAAAIDVTPDEAARKAFDLLWSALVISGRTGQDHQLCSCGKCKGDNG